MKDKDLLKLLLQKDNQVEVIAVHGKDVPIGLLNAILKRTGLK